MKKRRYRIWIHRNPSRDYTGNEVKLSNADLAAILYTGRDFMIAGYSNNVKKGTARVTLKGTGAYAGTKTLTFKIVKKKVDYKGKLGGGKY
ncbi:MAG: hypothetical protein K6F35_06075 [Lachnospiraceae bacterium]|nr:hypothetical protein [Lachnospiraceae bacterium]